MCMWLLIVTNKRCLTFQWPPMGFNDQGLGFKVLFFVTDSTLPQGNTDNYKCYFIHIIHWALKLTKSTNNLFFQQFMGEGGLEILGSNCIVLATKSCNHWLSNAPCLSTWTSQISINSLIVGTDNENWIFRGKNNTHDKMHNGRVHTFTVGCNAVKCVLLQSSLSVC